MTIESNVEAGLRGFSDGLRAQAYGSALFKQSRVVRKRARKRNYGFRDRRGRLRLTIRSRRIPGRYGRRVYKRGRAEVVAGAEGARQAYLVEAGHGGPWPARPHPYLARALRETVPEQAQAYATEMRRQIPLVAARANRRRMKRRKLV